MIDSYFFVRITFFILFIFSNLTLLSQDSIPIYLDKSKSIEERIEHAISLMSIEDKIAMCHAQSRFSAKGNPELGIPELHMSDGPHGIRMEMKWDSWDYADWTNDSCTAFPALTCLAATFDKELAFVYGKALGEESRYRRKDVLLGPGVNIYRTPFNGRNFEYMGEDPYLASQLVVPYIKGVQLNGVAACLKHLAMNNQEKDRHTINVEASDRALHEIYLPAFKAGVIEGKVWSVMGAYNQFRGEYCNQNDLLLNQILKKDWNFDGVVISDWGSVNNTRKAALSGLDIEMGSFTDRKNAYTQYYLASPYLKMIQSGEIPIENLNDKVRRILRLHFRTTMNLNRPFGSLASKDHFQISQRVSESGIILLKNQNDFFPVKKDKYKNILVIGENAIKELTSGGGSSELKVKQEVSPLSGLQNIYGKDKVFFTLGYSSQSINEQSQSESSHLNQDSLLNKAVEMAKKTDAVIFIGGLNKDRNQDSEAADRLSYDLPYNQNRVIESLLKANKNTGIVIISGNGYAMPWIEDANALIQSWYLGSASGTALANVISGKVNPSGRLPFSIPVKLEDNGAHAMGEVSYPGVNGIQIYKEDILVGYRWHDTKKIKTQFPFGHGLSYTTFDINNIKVDKKNYSHKDSILVSFDIKNTGKYAGYDVIQIFTSQQSPSLIRPTKELKGFEKMFLKAGESKRVSITIPVKDLSYYHDQKKKWVLESDYYLIHMASSAEKIIKSFKIRIN